MDEEKFKKEFEKFYPGAKLKLRPEEKARRNKKKLRNSLIFFVCFSGVCLMSGAPAYAYPIAIILSVAVYFGVKESELDD